MITSTRTYEVYTCETCHVEDKHKQFMEVHETRHKRTAALEINDIVDFRAQVGDMPSDGMPYLSRFTGTVIAVNVLECKVLLERDNGERRWADIEDVLTLLGKKPRKE